MGVINFKHKGNFNNLERFLKNVENKKIENMLTKYADEGVRALSAATPKRSGTTAGSWGYEIEMSSNSVRINWINTNINKGVPIAIIIQYGHGTGTGGYVEGIDYINPAMRPIFDKISEAIWKEMSL